MRDLCWKLLLSAAFALQASGASAEKLCNYNNPASPDYCTNADLNEQKARFRSVNDAYTASKTSDADRRWRGTLFDQMRARLTTCGNNVAQVIGCEFDVYRWASDTLQGRLDQRSQAPAQLAAGEHAAALTKDQASESTQSEPVSSSNTDDDSISDAAASAAAYAGQDKTKDSADEYHPGIDEENNSENLTHNADKNQIFGFSLGQILLFISVILAQFLMGFRALKKLSGVRERKIFLFSLYCSFGFLIEPIINKFFLVQMSYFVGIPLAIWGPRVASYPIRRQLLRFYGFHGHDLEEEFRSWTTRHGAYWANFRYGAIASTLSREQRALGQLLPHRSLGKCRAGVGHLEAECGDCDVIGCFEPECANHNFSDNNTCLQCGHKASLRGGGY